eukprot:gnl/MRDRNA2_/MRDRNA2_140546_c0_seq1.p1 gnl/MRDRNA2_/MRDRNA2_140546_c0~~gnl/MRDRNA2_/MRDRNA2_140546_c0_seq1.p1  ORF type:complete len:168 (-),score=29.30 gnl/MRDRNA2_/MRDRNA2_140546_c0_seq1:120-623(-)
MGCTESREKKDLCLELEKLGLGLRRMPADGHCLYKAIEHQLLRCPGKLRPQEYGFQQLRDKAADWLQDHYTEMSNFMPDCTPSSFEQYVKGVRNHSWGGDLEINALSTVLQRCIQVYQSNQGFVWQAGDDFVTDELPPLQVAFHRNKSGMSGTHERTMENARRKMPN